MSGQGLPYRLRPNKYIDRELFAEFVSLVVADHSPEKYAYVSMGGNHLTDHLAIYRRAGIMNLYAFDHSDDVVNRQKFNAPFEKVCCLPHSSDEIPARLDNILAKFGAENSIIWLDFTETKRLSQLKELEELSKKLEPGDVLRVTFNADFTNLNNREANLRKSEKDLPLPEKNALLLRLELGGYLPNSVKSVYFNEITKPLSLSVERAIRNGLDLASGEKKAIPVLLTEYHDTCRMFTATVMITDGNDEPSIPKSWAHRPETWEDIRRIYAPDLSTRERYAIDHLMHKKPSEVVSELNFPLDDQAVESYAQYHRFYPNFQPIAD